MKRLLAVVASVCMMLGSSTVLAGGVGAVSRNDVSAREEGLASRANALLARIHEEGLVAVTLKAQDLPLTATPLNIFGIGSLR